jgi:hypothetical protein
MAEITLGLIYRIVVNPKARRANSTAIIHSGGRRTIYGCVCGATHTEATDYRGKSKHYADWRRAHKDCMFHAIQEKL